VKGPWVILVAPEKHVQWDIMDKKKVFHGLGKRRKESYYLKTETEGRLGGSVS